MREVRESLKGNRKIQKPLQEKLATKELIDAATDIATKYKISLFNLINEFRAITNKEE